MAQNKKKDQERRGRRRRTLGLIVVSTVATAPFGCDDNTRTALDGAAVVAEMDAGASPDATETQDALAMDTGSQVDAMSTADSDTDAGGAVDAAQEYPSGVRG